MALAHINGIQELDILRKAYAESGSTLERVLTELGLIEIRSPESDDILVQLRKDLTIDSYLFIRPFRQDILSILRNTRKPLAVLIASWESVYNEVSLSF